MSNFWRLIKTNFFVTFNLNKILKRNKEGKLSLLFGTLVVLVSILFYFFAFFYLLMFGHAFYEGGKPELILLLSLSLGFIVVLISTLTLSNNYIYRSKDFELLMAMPIKPIVIISSKLAYLLILNYLIFSLVYIPSIFVYCIFNEPTVIFWVLVVPTFIIIPFLPMAISSMISYLFGFVRIQFKYKNLVSIVFTIAMFIGIMFISMNSQIIEENPVLFALKTEETLSKLFFIRYAFEGMQGSLVKYLFFCLIFIVPFIFFIIFISKNILAANARSKNAYVNKKFKLYHLKVSNQSKALIIKELKRYFNTSIYVINTMIGPILTVFAIIVLYVSRGSDILNVLGDFFPLILILALVGSMCFTSTTACSLSIEGKQFWILKSLPIKTKHVFWAKIVVNLAITVPVLIIVGILSTILFKLSIIDMVFIILIPTIVVFHMSYIGLFINLIFPRFDYDSDVKVVKQSLSVIITLIVGMITVIIFASLGFLLYQMFLYPYHIIYIYLVLTALALMYYSISYILLFKVGFKFYNKLDC